MQAIRQPSDDPSIDTDDDHEYVFVYGTLQNGTGYDAVLEGVRKDDSGRFPTLVADPEGRVEGEVHKVTRARLEELDQYEGTPHLYKRISGPAGVWVYVGNPERLGAESRFPFDREHLEGVIGDAGLSIRSGSDPRTIEIEEASDVNC